MGRKVLYVTGTRADFGLMSSTLHLIAAHPDLSLQVAVTGMHLSADCGMTVREIESLALPIVARIRTSVDLRNEAAMADGIAQTLLGLTETLQRHQPDVVLLLGDRGEMLAGAIAALHLGKVVAHLHGGERSGTVDEPVRHAISKLSHWHFTATAESRRRLIGMGERPDHIWVTGAPSLDGLTELANRPRSEVLASLGLQREDRYALVLFHPVVQEAADAFDQTKALVQALHDTVGARGMKVVWLAPNADAGSTEILRGVQASDDPMIRRVTHMNRSLYLGALAQSDLLVGNSSSGIIEAASVGTPVVNIGNRQRARERNSNVIDCAAEYLAIVPAVDAALEHGQYQCRNRYGEGRAGEQIVELLATQNIDSDLLNKVNVY